MAATDDYVQTKDRTRITEPAENAAAVTPSDGTDLGHVTRALIVGVAGDVKVDMLGGGTVVIPLPVGWWPLRVKRVWATGTTAGGIVAVW